MLLSFLAGVVIVVLYCCRHKLTQTQLCTCLYVSFVARLYVCSTKTKQQHTSPRTCAQHSCMYLRHWERNPSIELQSPGLDFNTSD